MHHRKKSPVPSSSERERERHTDRQIDKGAIGREKGKNEELVFILREYRIFYKCIIYEKLSI